MDISKFLLKNEDTGQPSTARSVFLYGCLVCLAKLLLSGVALGPIQLGVFSGGDFALAIGALGGIYSLDKVVRTKDA